MKKILKAEKEKTENLDKKLIYILAFAMPIIIIALYTVIREVISGGNFFFNGETFLVSDMHQQYSSIYSYIWDVLHGNESIFYSFTKELGSEMITTIGYYAASPFNVLLLFFERTDIPLAVFLIYMLKIGACGLTSFIFFNYTFGEKKSNLIFSLLYAFCNYCIAFYFHSMWLDTVYMAPLILMGIDKLIKKKPLMYIITLALTVIFNFYIGYMLCIFCVIYFLYKLFINYSIKAFKEYWKIILLFIISSLLAGGIACIMLIPVGFGLTKVFRIDTIVDSLFISQSNFKNAVVYNFIAQLGFGSYSPYDMLEYTPKLYSGVIVLLLVYLYFVNKKISRKERILSGIVLLIFISSFMFTIPFVIWHGFIYPGGYAGRHAFLFSLFMILLAAHSYSKLDKVGKKSLIIFIIIYTLINSILFLKIPYIDKRIVRIVNIVLIIVYSWLIYKISKEKKKDKKQKFKIAMFIIVFIELVANYKFGIATKKEINMSGQVSAYQNEVCSKFRNLSDSFYRVDGSSKFGFLDSMLCDVNGTSSIITTSNRKYIYFWQENSENVAPLGTYYNANRLPILDSILSIRYIHDSMVNENTYYKKIKEFSYGRYNIYNNKARAKNMYLYENQYALNLGYLIPSNHQIIYDQEEIENGFDSLNRLMKTLSGNEEDVLIRYPRKYLGKNKYLFNINNDEEYVYFTLQYYMQQTLEDFYDSDSLRYNGDIIANTSITNNGMIRLKNNYSNKEILIELIRGNISNTKDGGLYAYWLDMDTFEKDIEKLKEHQLQNIIVDKCKIYGDIDVEEDSVLFMSIPYDDNWKVYVDGKETSYEEVANFFIGIKLDKGHHEIKMVYKLKSFKYGLIVSLVSIFMTIIMVLFIKGRGINEKK